VVRWPSRRPVPAELWALAEPLIPRFGLVDHETQDERSDKSTRFATALIQARPLAAAAPLRNIEGRDQEGRKVSTTSGPPRKGGPGVAAGGDESLRAGTAALFPAEDVDVGGRFTRPDAGYRG
jgi:hypothetical protein